MPIRSPRLAVPNAAAPAAPAASQYLAVPFRAQEQSNWCWAACAQMVFAYNGFSISQCDLAQWLSDYLGSKGDCCKDPGSCDRGATDSEISALYASYGYSATYSFSQASFASLSASIGSDWPVEVGLSWTGGGGHVVIVNGWQSNGGNYVYVSDPGQGSAMGFILYTELQSAYGQGVWDATWTSIHP